MRRLSGTRIAFIALSASLVWPAVAQSNDADSLAKFMACAEIENPPLRYACFDETAAAVKLMQAQPSDPTFSSRNEPLTTPETDIYIAGSTPSERAVTTQTSRTPSVASNEETQTDEQKKRGLFGFIGGLTQPARTEEEFGLEEDPEDPEVITEITGKIADFRISGTGRLIVLLDNGQVWQQISGDTTRLPERTMRRQTSATIETAALGSFLMRLSPSEQSIRVRRIQ